MKWTMIYGGQLSTYKRYVRQSGRREDRRKQGIITGKDKNKEDEQGKVISIKNQEDKERGWQKQENPRNSKQKPKLNNIATLPLNITKRWLHEI